MTAVIRQTVDLPLERLEALRMESLAEAFQGVQRMCDAWREGTNRFDGPDETIFLAERHGDLVALCGVNRCPHADDPAIARLRHLYVLKHERRQGVGRALVEAAVDFSRPRYRHLRLRTTNPGASRFYLALGFRLCESGEPESTHWLDLTSTLA